MNPYSNSSFKIAVWNIVLFLQNIVNHPHWGFLCLALAYCQGNNIGKNCPKAISGGSIKLLQCAGHFWGPTSFPWQIWQQQDRKNSVGYHHVIKRNTSSFLGKKIAKQQQLYLRYTMLWQCHRIKLNGKRQDGHTGISIFSIVTRLHHNTYPATERAKETILTCIIMYGRGFPSLLVNCKVWNFLTFILFHLILIVVLHYFML